MAVGKRPLEMLAQGCSVRLDQLERRRPELLKSPLLKRLKDTVAPGRQRSPSLSLTWAPPWVSSTPRAGAKKSLSWMSHRFYLQIFGAREWTICGDALGPPGPSPPGDCRRFQLRRGDLLYVPPGRWHSAAVGAALSAHLTLALQPMTLQELLLAGGKRGEGLNGLPGAGAPGLVRPLPLWRPDASPALRELCLSLPWHQTWRRDETCNQDHLHLALQRLFLGVGHSTPRKILPRPEQPEVPTKNVSEQEVLVVEGREGSRQRRKRELMIMALCWPVLLFLVTLITYLCCPGESKGDVWKKYQ